MCLVGDSALGIFGKLVDGDWSSRLTDELDSFDAAVELVEEVELVFRQQLLNLIDVFDGPSPRNAHGQPRSQWQQLSRYEFIEIFDAQKRDCVNLVVLLLEGNWIGKMLQLSWG